MAPVRGRRLPACALVFVLAASAGCGSGARPKSGHTPAPSGKLAAPQPICIGWSDIFGVPATFWISARGIGFNGEEGPLCHKPPKRWGNVHRPFDATKLIRGAVLSVPKKFLLEPPRKIDASVVRGLYRAARRARSGTMPSTPGKTWRRRDRQCFSSCAPAYAYMEFGGRTVFDGSDRAEAWACPELAVDGRGTVERLNGRRVRPKLTGETRRFALLFARVASLTPYCYIRDRNPSVE